ncbi:MAG: ATP-binding protein [candidate division Zixibacteria bacterium]|nr:ATP-binding protein [Candidatus Tariuqbacter arcticus]
MTIIKTLDIPSTPDELTKVDEVAERVAEEMSFSKDEKDDIAISVSEAVNNAIMHGNLANPKKMVHITFIRERDSLIVKVRDEGNGFNPDDLPDPTSPENLLRLKGRGIFIIRQLMDEVTHRKTNEGMEVTLVKKKNAG